jgi:hypothetical protein
VEITLMACENIEFVNNDIDKFYLLGKVINEIGLDVLPSVENISVFIKLFYIPDKEVTDLQVAIYDDENEMIAHSNKFVVHNSRPDKNIPGIDTHLNMSFVVCKEGIITIMLYINDEIRAKYPIRIDLYNKERGVQ